MWTRDLSRILYLTDAEGNARTENIKNANGYTVPQLTLNAGEEITLNVKAMPGMTDAECAGSIASQKQFTVSTNKTALTATTVDTNTGTLKAADAAADMTVTVKSPQYYRKVTLPENAAFANEKNVAVSENLQAIKVMNNEVILNVKKSFEIPVTGGTVDGGKTTIPATEDESTSFKPDAPADGKQIDEVRVNGEKVAPNEDGSYTIPNPTEDTTR